MQSIRTKYAYNYKHDKALLKVIMTELAKVDSVWTLKDALAPSTATANSVADTIEQLKTMTGNILRDCYDKYNEDDTMSDYNTAYGVTTMTQAPTRRATKPDAAVRVTKQRRQMIRPRPRKRKRRRTIAPIARSSTNAAHTPTYPRTSVSGTKSTKAGAPGRYATS